jgi:cytochrome P450
MIRGDKRSMSSATQSTHAGARGPHSFFSLSPLLAMRRNPLTFMEELHGKYGDLINYRTLGRQVFMLFHPEMTQDMLITRSRNHHQGRVMQRSRKVLGNGLLTSEDSFHLRQRRLIQPAFHRQRVFGYGRAMVDYAERHQQRWRDGEVLDIHQEMMRLTLAIVGKTLFDTDVEGDSQEIGSALNTFMHLFKFAVLPFSEYLERLPIPPVLRMRRARERIDRVIYRFIEERRRTGEDRGDLLSMLLAAEDNETVGEGNRMDNDQIRDECVTLILAGHETTANALTWTLYLLAQHPTIAQRLTDQLNQVLGQRAPEPEDYPNLKYAEMVFSESMRLYPPAWGIARTVIEPYEAFGVAFPKDAIILTSQWITHRDPRWYPDPLSFDPERWTVAARAGRPKFAYFPFGAGPRQCIGESFAWMEGVLLLASIVRNWNFSVVPETRVELLPLITLRPKFGMKLRVEKR